MTKIAPGGDPISDASQQAAQQMVQEARAAKAAQAIQGTPDSGSGQASASHMKFAVQKIVHTPETQADYQKRITNDRKLKGLHLPGNV